MAKVTFYQTNTKTGETTFNLQYEIESVDFDANKFAAMMANKLMSLRELYLYAKANGMKLGFSLVKPMWFKFESGTHKIESSEYVARQFQSYIKMKKGTNEPTKTQLKAMVLVALRSIQEAVKIDETEF